MNELKTPFRTSHSYASDFYAWTADQARELRRVKPDHVDWENLAEEVESLGRSDRRAIGSGLKIVLEHLIKRRFQADRRSASWSDSIDERRDRIARVVEDSPSLARTPGEILQGEYAKARRKALRDTRLPAETIPLACPFTVEEALDPDFLPDGDRR